MSCDDCKLQSSFVLALIQQNADLARENARLRRFVKNVKHAYMFECSKCRNMDVYDEHSHDNDDAHYCYGTPPCDSIICSDCLRKLPLCKTCETWFCAKCTKKYEKLNLVTDKHIDCDAKKPLK
jgi:hypothetical protein